MELEVGNTVLYQNKEVAIIGFSQERNYDNILLDVSLTNLDSWDPSHHDREKVHDKFSYGEHIDISSYSKCWWVNQEDIVLLIKDLDEEIINIKEDLSMERIILKKLIKLEKKWLTLS